MGDFAVVQFEIVWRAVVGFETGEVLRAEMRIRRFAGMDREQEQVRR